MSEQHETAESWSVYTYDCPRCGQHIAAVCPDDVTPLFEYCTTCVRQMMDQHIAAEHDPAEGERAA